MNCISFKDIFKWKTAQLPSRKIQQLNKQYKIRCIGRYISTSTLWAHAAVNQQKAVDHPLCCVGVMGYHLTFNLLNISSLCTEELTFRHAQETSKVFFHTKALTFFKAFFFIINAAFSPSHSCLSLKFSYKCQIPNHCFGVWWLLHITEKGNSLTVSPCSRFVFPDLKEEHTTKSTKQILIVTDINAIMI